MNKQTNVDRVIHDIEEGIIILDNKGTITSINPQAEYLLDINKNLLNQKYAILFVDDKYKNDEFHQMLIDATNDNMTVHKRKIHYKTAKIERILYMTSSIIKDDNEQRNGALISFEDISIQEELARKRNISALIFIILVALLTLWMFACALFINAHKPMNSTLFGRIIMYLPLLFTPIAINICGFSINDLGLRTRGIKKYVITDSIFAILAVLAMCVVKILLLKFVPSFTFHNLNNQFFDFTKYTILGRLEYAICVISQEYLSRGLVYESIKRIIETDINQSYVDAIAIVVSSLYFAALHIYLGPIYMIGAFILLSLFGIIYKKQKSIWGLCIPHFILGVMIDVLGFTIR